MEFIIAIVIIVFIIIALVSAIRIITTGKSDLPIFAIPIMTKHELIFARKLNQALEEFEFHLFPQMPFAAFLKILPGTERKLAFRVRNKFSQKRADFAIADDDMKVILIVELDDKTHNASKDRARDEILGSAGIPTVRLRNGYAIKTEEILAAIKPHLLSYSEAKSSKPNPSDLGN